MAQKLLCVLLSVGLAHANYYKTQENLGQELFNDYNGEVKPEEHVNISLQMYVRDIFEINTRKGYMDTQLTIRQEWYDQRLAFNNKPQFSDIEYFTVGHEQFKKVWVPDTFIRNEISSHMFDTFTPNYYLRIFPDGKILYSTRLSLRSVCNPYWQFQTFDTLKCPIEIASYGWQKKDVEYSWREENPIQVNKEVSLRGFVFMPQFTKNEKEDQNTSSGVYSKARTTFLFKKAIDYNYHDHDHENDL